jgi:thiosulfate reductase cytochrome b subunit
METIIKKTIAYLSLVIIALYLITGYGMTKSETIGKLTFGLLDRSLSHTIHFNLVIPLIILLLAHIFLACGWLRFFKKHEECEVTPVNAHRKKKSN